MRTLVVYAHPVEGSLCSAVRDRVVAGLHAGGHRPDVLDLYAEGAAPERESRADELERVLRAEALVFVYPTWWGGPPAILTGWLDRIVQDAPPLPARRIVVVTTHGSPRRVNLVEGEPGRLLLTRHLPGRCRSGTRAVWLALYGVDSATPRRIARYLDRVGQRTARPRL